VNEDITAALTVLARFEARGRIFEGTLSGGPLKPEDKR
jgi:hypothetical protein